jgi:hypothetical protein
MDQLGPLIRTSLCLPGLCLSARLGSFVFGPDDLGKHPAVVAGIAVPPTDFPEPEPWLL